MYTKFTCKLTGSHVGAEFVPPATPNAPVHIMQVSDVQTNTGYNYIGWIRVNTSDLVAVVNSGGVTIAQTTLTYSAVDHKYLRISEASGVVALWTSADGQAWTSRLTAASPPWGSGLTALYLNFFSITFGADLGLSLRVDSVNGNGNAAVGPLGIAAPATIPAVGVAQSAGVVLAAIAAPAVLPALEVATGGVQRDTMADPFTGVNGAVTTYGRTALKWDAVVGAGNVTSNQVTGTTSGGFDIFRTVDYYPIGDMFAEVVVGTLSAVSDRSASVIVRAHESEQTYYVVEINELHDRFVVVRVVGGVGTNISGGFVGLSSPLALPATLRAEVQGNAVRAYLDGELVGEFFDDVIVAGKRAGFGFYNSNGVSRIDSFESGHLGNAAVSPAAIAAVAVVPTPAVASGGLAGVPGLVARWVASSLGLANGDPVSSWAPEAGSLETAPLTATGTQRPTFSVNAGVAPTADVGATTSTLRQGSVTGPRLLLAGMNVWGVADSVVTTAFGDGMYNNRAAIATTLKSWGVNYVRMRLYAHEWNGASTAARAVTVQKAVDWRNILRARGILTCFCWWDALDGPYAGALWDTEYTRSFAMMSAVAAAMGNDEHTFYEPFNEPNNVSNAQWDTATRATVAHFRNTIGYKGLLVVDTNQWSHLYDDTLMTGIETYDATLTGTGRANVAFARHDYGNEYSGHTWNAATWAAENGGSARKHVIVQTEYGVYNVGTTTR